MLERVAIPLSRGSFWTRDRTQVPHIAGRFFTIWATKEVHIYIDMRAGPLRRLNTKCFWTVMLEYTLKSLMDSKEIKPVYPKGNQTWIFIGRTDVEAEAPILWPPDAKNRLIGKDPDAGKDWRQEEKGMTEDEMFGWHDQHNEHKSEQTLGDSEGQGSLVCFSSCGCQELNAT